jgi:hypothetical protein
VTSFLLLQRLMHQVSNIPVEQECQTREQRPSKKVCVLNGMLYIFRSSILKQEYTNVNFVETHLHFI